MVNCILTVFLATWQIPTHDYLITTKINKKEEDNVGANNDNHNDNENKEGEEEEKKAEEEK